LLGSDLSKLGQSTHVARSTVAQVRARIAQLREQSKTKVDAKNYDFNKRLEEVRAAEREKREARREERRRKRAEEREREELARLGVEGKRGEKEVEAAVAAQQSMEDMMGFGGFGGSKRK
jgi:U4/U6.U5 tri-snRNP component SNU23